MKRLILFLTILFSTSNFGQLLDGTIAPDFTVVDITGNQHTLSSYLAMGKTVILDFNSVNCGPCWTYHHSKALDDFYYAYGPNGSNEVVVLFIEAGYTTVNTLNGLGPNSLGNWVDGTSYPMIIDPATDTLFTLYAVGYNPMIYRICPNGVINQIPQLPSNSLKYNNCSINYSGVQNHVRALNSDEGFCSANGSFTAKIINYGTNDVNLLTLNLKKNGSIVNTKNFNGIITQFETKNIEFDDVPIDANATYTFEIVNVNGVQNRNPSLSVAEANFYIANSATVNLDVLLHTNHYPNNNSWRIRNSDQTIVASGGPYINTQSTNFNNTIISQTITLAANDCYSLDLLAPGYGWMPDYFAPQATPGIEVYSNSSLVYQSLNVGNFGSIYTKENFLVTNLLSVPSFESKVFLVYPNPTEDFLTLNYDKSLVVDAITILDITGKRIIENRIEVEQINVQRLQKGLYFIQIQSQGKTFTQKFIKE